MSDSKKILITGSSGLVGLNLVPHLVAKGFEVTTLKGEALRQMDSISDAELNKFENLFAVIHLAGKNLSDQRWNSEIKKQILESRKIPTENLSKIIKRLKNPPKVFLSASAIGFYGDRDDEVLSESSSSGSNFLSDVCRDWEDAAKLSERPETRVVKMRLGMVLSKDGGALQKMLPPFRLNLGTAFGSGKQWVSWISIWDLIRAIDFSLQNEKISGAVNFTSPESVTNLQFSKTLAKVLNKKLGPKVPAFALKLLLGEMGEALILSSAKVLPKKLLENGFEFEFADLEKALRKEL